MTGSYKERYPPHGRDRVDTGRVRPVPRQPGALHRPMSDATPVPMVGDPPHVDVTETLTRLHRMVGDLDKKVSVIHELTPEQLAALKANESFSATIDEYEKKLSPWRKLWAFTAAIGGVAIFIFGAGIAYQQFMGGNATKADIETHKHEDLEPVQEDVAQIKEDLEPVKEGVKSLVDVQEKEHKVKKLKRQLERHDKEYQEALQEYTADKAAGQRSSRPRKTAEHIRLEAEVKEAEDKL